MNRPTRLLYAFSFWLVAVEAPAQTPARADRSFSAYGTHIGTGGIRVSAANGSTEVLVPSGATNAVFPVQPRYWILHRYDPARQTYDQVFVSPEYPLTDGIARTAVGDLLPAAGPEIVIATTNGTVEIWNQATRSLLATFMANIGTITGMGVGDADNNGSVDVVLCSANTTRALDAASATFAEIAD